MQVGSPYLSVCGWSVLHVSFGGFYSAVFPRAFPCSALSCRDPPWFRSLPQALCENTGTFPSPPTSICQSRPLFMVLKYFEAAPSPPRPRHSFCAGFFPQPMTHLALSLHYLNIYAPSLYALCLWAFPVLTVLRSCQSSGCRTPPREDRE